ncbi:MAG: OmpA family protein [Nannocystis sp.]|uniref:OmpA family protein n=1 Tax=Nannocystis sp. TaxID=1962667 RepID=UPI0024249472|nr:OmpA family protein [Nannocystis sp.]MBK9757948.1 OmpA family protein [Nannocystis sp.]
MTPRWTYIGRRGLPFALAVLLGGPAHAAAPPPADAPARPWIRRFRPQAHSLEPGAFVGTLFPSRNHELYQYDRKWQPYARVAPTFGLRLAYFPLRYLGAELEGALAPTTVASTRALLFAARGHLIAQLPLSSVVPFILIGGGLLGTRGDALGADLDLVSHFGGGLKIHVHRNVAIRLDLRGTVGSGHGTETRRVVYPELLLGVSVPLNLRGRDSDDDGLYDPGQRARPTDACPQQPGRLGDRGCPDRDDDRVPDPDDHCPAEPGQVDRRGCPSLRDSDADGVYDPGQVDIPPPGGDLCPALPGEPAHIGCPPPDSDNDGELDSDDRCPDKAEVWNGYQDDDGCPDEIPVDLAAIVGTLRGINFAFMSDRITAGSRPALDHAAAVMRTYPSIRIEVQGHTDSEGEAAVNEEVSRRRAESVRQYLIQAGVPAERLRAVGRGGAQPIADNNSARGKAKNRRIELVLVNDHATGAP